MTAEETITIIVAGVVLLTIFGEYIFYLIAGAGLLIWAFISLFIKTKEDDSRTVY